MTYRQKTDRLQADMAFRQAKIDFEGMFCFLPASYLIVFVEYARMKIIVLRRESSWEK